MSDEDDKKATPGTPEKTPRTPEITPPATPVAPDAPVKRACRRLRLDDSTIPPETSKSAGKQRHHERFFRDRKVSFKTGSKQRRAFRGSHVTRLYSRLVATSLSSGHLGPAELMGRIARTFIRTILDQALAHNPSDTPVQTFTMVRGGQAIELDRFNEAFLFIVILSDRAQRHGGAPCGSAERAFSL